MSNVSSSYTIRIIGTRFVSYLPAFLVLVLGAMSLFLANFVMRAQASVEIFEVWSYLLAYVTLFSSISLFGSEQLIVRFGNHEERNELALSKSVIKTILFCGVTFLIVFLWHVNGVLLRYEINWLVASIMIASVGVIQFQSQKLRICKRFVQGQTVVASWKIVLLFVVVLLIFSGRELSAANSSAFFAGALLLTAVISSFSIRV